MARIEGFFAEGRGCRAVSLRHEAASGDAAAQYELGKICRYGYDIKEDKAKLMEWYQAAVDRGEARNLRLLASSARELLLWKRMKRRRASALSARSLAENTRFILALSKV